MARNFTQALRDEVSWQAKKVIRAEVGALKRSSARYRRDIAELKRLVMALERRLAGLERQESRRLARPAPTELADTVRFSPKWLKAHRKRVGLTAADYAKLIGVHEITIYNWENEKSRPRKSQIAAWAAIRNLGRRELLQRLGMIDDVPAAARGKPRASRKAAKKTAKKTGKKKAGKKKTKKAGRKKASGRPVGRPRKKKRA